MWTHFHSGVWDAADPGRSRPIRLGALDVKVTSGRFYWPSKAIRAGIGWKPLMESVIGPVDQFISCSGCENSFHRWSKIYIISGHMWIEMWWLHGLVCLFVAFKCKIQAMNRSFIKVWLFGAWCSFTSAVLAFKCCHFNLVFNKFKGLQTASATRWFIHSSSHLFL